MRIDALRKCLALFPVLALLCVSLHAQDYRGRIQGTVLDTSQAAVVGATVTLANVKTGVSAMRTTGETGRYLFDLVEPGTYTLTVEFTGFSKFVQENVLAQSRGDLTVDAMLRAGSIQETVTVSAQTTAVQFNSAKLESTMDSQLVNNLPHIYRNPFLLAGLDPAVEQEDGYTAYDVYQSWSAQRQKVGGGAFYTHDVQVDGSPVGIGPKTSYIPAPEMVQEVSIQQNAVDAEYGHSSGSAINLTLKSGNNEWHGTTFYQGHYPWANAIENRVFRTHNQGRNHMYGGTLGHPIIKNKLFNFIAYEGWKQTGPGTAVVTLPTDLEKEGDYSQSLNRLGGPRTIYDPWSTKTSADGATITRMPFAGNRIPLSEQDPVARKFVSLLWKPNVPGTGPLNLYNYQAARASRYEYKNFTDRVDYNVTDALRVYGRFSRMRTPVTIDNPTGSGLYLPNGGAQRNSDSISGDVVYTLSPQTVLNVHGDWHKFVDDATYNIDSSAPEWSTIYPNNDFYKVMFGQDVLEVKIPRMTIMGTGSGEKWLMMGPQGGYWKQRPTGDSFNMKVAHNRGAHYLKAGFDSRSSRSLNLLVNNHPGFGFQANATSATYVNPDVRTSGDGFATFLLGVVQPAGNGAAVWNSGSTSMPVQVLPEPQSRFFAGYINDDWKVSRRLTINLGFRYEYQQAFQDPQDRLVRPLDLTSPIPEMQGPTAPVMPAELKQYYSGPTVFNGAFNFAGSDNRGQWNAGKGGISPRAGMVYRVNDKTSLRAAYGRYPTPWDLNLFDSPYYGFDITTGAPDAVQGVPQMRLREPFPSSFPISPSLGKSRGRYTGLGDSFSSSVADRPKMISQRVNVGVQRELPTGLVLDLTYYFNLTDQQSGFYNVNQVDPRVAYQYKSAINKSVNNPFYNFLTTEKFPGPMRYQSKVSLTSLMAPYPQYGTLTVWDGIEGGHMHYHSLQIRANKTFSKGYSLMAGYAYIFAKDQIFFDSIASYLQQWTWQDAANARHRLNIAGTWQVPLGRGRAFLNQMPRIIDAVLGGWEMTGVTTWRSGRFLRFGAMTANGSPVIDNPTEKRWFDTSVFSPLPAYTPRTNPMQYAGLTGPGMFNADASIVKGFHVTEKVRPQLRVDVFNAFNNMTLTDPSTGVQSATFGQAVGELSKGRRVQLGLRIEF